MAFSGNQITALILNGTMGQVLAFVAKAGVNPATPLCLEQSAAFLAGPDKALPFIPGPEIGETC